MVISLYQILALHSEALLALCQKQIVQNFVDLGLPIDTGYLASKFCLSSFKSDWPASRPESPWYIDQNFISCSPRIQGLALKNFN